MMALQHWMLRPLALLLLAALAGHELGVVRLRRRRCDGRAPLDATRQAWLLRAGLAWGVLTVVSPLGYWSRQLLFARVSLDLSFACVVAPLVALGAPWRPLAAGLSIGRVADGAAREARPAAAGAATRPAPIGPVGAIVLFLGSFLVWHIPAVADPTVSSEGLRLLEMACYLATGTVLWMQLVGSHPFEPAWPPLPRVGLITIVLGTGWVVGAAMVFTGSLWYPSFAGGPGTPLSRTMEQSLAGAITWVLPLLPFGPAAFWGFSEWIDRDEAEWQLHWQPGRHGHIGEPESLYPRRVGGQA